MKKIIALLMTLALAISAVAIPALAEDAGGAVDQVSSATQQNSQNNQAGRGGRGNPRQMPGQNGQMPGNGQIPGQNGQMPGQNSQVPDQNSQGTQNPWGMKPGKGGRRGGGTAGANGQAVKHGKLAIFDQLLADGVITQEIYDAISAWMQQKAPQAQQDTAAPAEGSEPPALPEGAQGEPAGMEAQLLKDLLDSGVITQAQYDMLLSRIQPASETASGT